MCSISGLVQFLIVVVTFLMICHGVVSQKWIISYKPIKPTVTMYETLEMCRISGLVLLMICHGVVSQKWRISYSPIKPTVTMYETLEVNYNISGPDNISDDQYYMIINSNNQNILQAHNKIELKEGLFNSGSFNITGNFLGKTSINVKVKNKKSQAIEFISEYETIVVRKQGLVDIIFTALVATLVSIIYIHFGCALNWGELRTNLKKPFGPVIGYIGQFLFMPVISFALGKVLFPNNPEMQLGMFFTGVSPGGGASNMWTVILGGNINLSIIMTTISTFAAFFMMPLWLFTLGRILLQDGNLTVPYKEISTYAVALVVTLFIGYLIQRFLKKLGQFFARILKGFSATLMICIIVFAVVANLYFFKLFSWQIIVAGLGLPWLGYLLAWALAKILKQPSKDCLTIAIETGIQNMGIAILLLRFTLPQPEADLTTVVPVAVAIMTQFPLLGILIYQQISERWCLSKAKIKKSSLNTDLEPEETHNETMVLSIT